MAGKRQNNKRLKGGKRTVQERERDLTLITDWYVQGIIPGRMAEWLSERYQKERNDEEFSISRTQIQKDIAVVVDRWRVEENEKISNMKAIAGQRIEAVYREYWDAWIKSKAGTTESESDARMPKKASKDSSTEGFSVAADGKVVFSQFKTTKSLPHGNIEFLRGASQCIEQHIKLYGLASPTKVAPTDPSGEKEYGANRMSEDERLQRLRELVAIGQERQQQAEKPSNQLLAEANAYDSATDEELLADDFGSEVESDLEDDVFDDDADYDTEDEDREVGDEE